ncbi:YesL family protein [Mesobacillus foraminis]|uniref:YesL family protein n=1 Tax=Mesobacillus foraminis TaxID=279826 RepID=UPI0039A04D78
METNMMTGKLFWICEWIMRLAFVNILWILFTASGLIIFGIMPASVAVFAVARKWITQGTDIPIFKTFFHTFKTEWLKSNNLGLILGLSGGFLFFDLVYIRTIPGPLQSALMVLLMIAFLFYIMTCLFILPVYVHYDLKLSQYIKHAFLIGLSNMWLFLVMIAGGVLLATLFYIIPGLAPFFAIALPAVVFMLCSLQAFNKIEQKQRKLSGQLSG